MESAKEKAEELIDKFLKVKSKKISDYSKIEWPTAKQCALVCIDEIIFENNLHLSEYGHERIIFWKQVKEEILNL